MKSVITALLMFCIATCAIAQKTLAPSKRLPILDMHLHALPADFSGPPPTSHCVPWREFPDWDQRAPYGATLGGVQKKPPCKDPVWSPMTDEAIMNESIA